MGERYGVPLLLTNFQRSWCLACINRLICASMHQDHLRNKTMNLSIVILAAGQGKRMNSNLPKPLHHLAGIPMFTHVLRSANQLEPQQIVVVYSKGLEAFQEAAAGQSITWVEQSEQLGTGHAVLQALSVIPQDHLVLVLYADVPLVKAECLRGLVQQAATSGVAVLSTHLENPFGLGRIVRDEGKIVGIVEEKDANDSQRLITEINTGMMAVSAQLLHCYLPQLSSQNAQNEYYLTDVIAMAAHDNRIIQSSIELEPAYVQGVNDKKQLACLERFYQRDYAHELLQQGVTLLDPERFDCRGTLQVGRDVTIDVGVIIEGDVSIGDGCYIGAYAVIKDTVIANGVKIKPYAHIEGAQIGNYSEIGPFARVRQGTMLAEACKLGNFVETKKAHLGAGTKVSHLSYIGDATVGEKVNIGAGTITCNYDGERKHATAIASGAFVGSNTALIAPVSIGVNAKIAAGSVITDSVPDNVLAIARERQVLVGAD